MPPYYVGNRNSFANFVRYDTKKRILFDMHGILNWKQTLYALLACLLIACSGGNEKPELPVVPDEPEAVIPQPEKIDTLKLETVEFKDIQVEGKSIVVKYQASGSVTVKCGDVWIKEASTNSNQTNQKTFTVAANGGNERTTQITFALGKLSEKVTVSQLGCEPVKEGEGYAWDIAKKLGLGWNIGNQLDAYNNGVADETCWGNQAATQQTFDKVAEAGFTSVRIPVTWMGHIGEAPDYQIEDAWLNRVAELVAYAENAKLNAIINMHHDGADSDYWLSIKRASASEEANEEIKNQLKAMWTQIATKFKDKGEFLIFESMNEIHDGGWGWGANLNDNGKQYAIMNEWNQVFVDAVRAVGGENVNRYLGIPGYCANVDLTLNHMALPADEAQNRLLVAVHFYDPYEYTLNNKYTEWGYTASSNKKDSWGDEDNVKKVFGQLRDHYVNQGVPVYIGEMGCVHRNSTRAEKFRKYYLEYVCKAARSYGLAPFYWDNGAKGTGQECSGLFDHATGEYLNNAEEVVAVMKKAIMNDEADYTLNTVYDEAPR